MGADALILDLEDSVAAPMKARARARWSAIWLEDRSARDWAFFVRPNPFDTGLTLEDLAAVVKPGLDGLMVPKTDGAWDIERIGHYLDALETRAGMAVGCGEDRGGVHRDGQGDVSTLAAMRPPIPAPRWA